MRVISHWLFRLGGGRLAGSIIVSPGAVTRTDEGVNSGMDDHRHSEKLPPSAPSVAEAVEDLPPDSTLAGYFREHNRPPAFTGRDGDPYSLSLETEKTPDLAAPYEGYLVFLRWAEGGLGVAGHLETPTLCKGKTQEDAFDRMGELTLLEVKKLLDEAIERRAARDAELGGEEAP